MNVIIFLRSLKRKICTFFNCLRSGLPYDSTWYIVGRIVILRYSLVARMLGLRKSGQIIIGKGFVCKNKVSSNTIGLIQPTVLNVILPDSKIVIGNNVGISGSTINATRSVSIGNNVLIGSGSIITDTDSHPILPEDRLFHPERTKSKPVIIEDNVLIGTRCIILKGVVIGKDSVIGAGSVVTKNIPPRSVACGNPAVVVKSI